MKIYWSFHMLTQKKLLVIMQNKYLVKMASRRHYVIHKMTNKFCTLTYCFTFIKYLLQTYDFSHSIFDHVALCTLCLHVYFWYWLRNEHEPLEHHAISFSNAWKWKVKVSHSVVSNSLRPHGLQPTRLLCPWDFPGKSTGVGCHGLLWRSVLVPLKFTS